MSIQLRYLKLIILLVIGFIVLGPHFSTANVSIGTGMAYESIKLKVSDRENRYFHTILQSTIGVAHLSYKHPWFTTGLEVGWSDWNVSGEWQGTNLNNVEGDAAGWWLAQQYYSMHVSIRPISEVMLGTRYKELRLRHHFGEYDITFLDIRQTYLDLYIGYDWYQTQGLTAFVELAYTPNVIMNISQNTQVPVEHFAVHDYQEQVLLTRWQGKIGLLYTDTMGWQLELTYGAGYSLARELTELKSLTITNGQLKGLFNYNF